MKRPLVLSLLFLSLSSFSTFAIDSEKLRENLENSQHLTELMMDEEYVKRQKAIAEEKRLKKEAETELYDGVLGVKYHLESSYILEGKFLRMEFFRKPGTFSIFCMPEGEGSVPLLATHDLSASTCFLMKLDEKVYHLGKSPRVLRELRRLSDGGAQLVYSFENGMRLIADFSFVASRESKPEDIIKVRLYVLNLGNENHSVDLKGIFDTICGEVSSVHFTTEKRSKIRFETRYSNSDLHSERTIISANDKAYFQFVLDSQNVTPIESVTLANIDELYKMDWDSGFRKGRGFSNIRGYDDSGIMIDWPEFALPPESKTEFTFYIAAATSDEYPLGLTYADGILVLDKKQQDDSALLDFNNQNPAQEEPQKENAVNSDKRTDVEFVVPPIKDYQLDSGYIQDLIDKIDRLQSSKNVDKKELMKLNAELDAILEKLRRQ
ncbi:MAG: hypothetical protein IJR39_05770 [Treponema sp.]|nr:hypothetical protein [Treponema sp.]